MRRASSPFLELPPRHRDLLAMSVEKVSRESPEGVEEKDQVVLSTLDARGERGHAVQPATLSRKQAISAYFTIAAAAFGLIRCV